MSSIPRAFERPWDWEKHRDPPAVCSRATPCPLDRSRASTTAEESPALTQDPHARRFGEKFLWFAEASAVPRFRCGKRSDQMARGASDQISFHLESAKQPTLQQTIEIFRQSGARVGLALKAETPLHLLMPWLDQVDTVLLLNIPPGAHGVSPSPTAFLRLQELKTLQRSRFPNFRIEIDGGVSAETVRTFAQLGADILVCGSIVFNGKGVQESISALRGILNVKRGIG